MKIPPMRFEYGRKVTMDVKEGTGSLTERVIEEIMELTEAQAEYVLQRLLQMAE